MKSKLPLFCLFLFSTVMACHATLSWIGNAYVILNPNSTGDTYYKVPDGSTGTPSFSGNLLTLQSGQSLMFGGEIQTWPVEDGVSVTLHYAVDQNTSFSSLNLSWYQNQDNNSWWHAVDAVNLDNGLSAGTHTIYVWFSATQGGTTIYDSNFGNNFSANFTISSVPESTNIALASFGSIALVAFSLRSLKSPFRPTGSQ